jgi:hypothetical protein
MEVTSSGLTPFALVTIVFSVVTGVTVLVALVGILIDRDAARHERKGDQ